MTKFLTVFSFLVFLSFSSYGQADQDYTKTLKEMFEVSGSEGAYQAAIEQMLVIFKQQYPKVEEDVWNEFETEFTKTSLDDLTEMLVPVYSKHMTKSDLEELIIFYRTPVGKKFAQNSPMIVQESMQVGQEWGMKIGQDFSERMKERGN